MAEHGFLLIMLCIGTAFTFGWIGQCRDELHMNLPACGLISVLHTVFGVLCVTVFAVLETMNLDNFGNLSIYGGVFFMPIYYFAIAKIFKADVSKTFDIFTICVMFTLMCARVNCLHAGCCKGLIIPGTEGMRWPTREAEIIFYIIMLIWLGRKVKSGNTIGEIYPLYMFSYGIFRFIDEFFRESDSGGLIHISHIWSIVAFCLGLSVYVEIKKRSFSEFKSKKARRKK